MSVARYILLLFCFMMLVPEGLKANQNKEIWEALINMSSAKIPQDKIDCELKGIKVATVGDFFIEYIRFTMGEGEKKFMMMECNERDTPNCFWSYGQNPTKKDPSWNVALRFQYNKKSKTVDPTSLECLQTP